MDQEKQVKKAVDEAIVPLVVAVDNVRLNREEDMLAIIGATKRIEGLEVIINNGLTDATRQTKEDVDEIKVTMADMQAQISEMYGWLKATHDTKWAGEERRNT